MPQADFPPWAVLAGVAAIVGSLALAAAGFLVYWLTRRRKDWPHRTATGDLLTRLLPNPVPDPFGGVRVDGLAVGVRLVVGQLVGDLRLRPNREQVRYGAGLAARTAASTVA